MENTNQIKFNKVAFKINKEFLKEEYKLFSICYIGKNKKGNVLTTISQNKKLLSEIHSCCFKDYTETHVLTKKDISSYALPDIVINEMDIYSTNDTLLLNLILYLQTTNTFGEPISRLDGQYYLFMDTQNIDDQIITIKLRFKDGDFGTYLSSDVKTFTKFSKLPEHIKNQCKEKNVPKYALTTMQTLTRTNETDENKVYVNRVKGPYDKHEITECCFDNKNFAKCKVFSYYLIYKILNPENNDYILSFDFIGDDFDPINKEFIKYSMPQLSPHNICIINTTENIDVGNNVEALLNDIKNEFNITNVILKTETIDTIQSIQQEENTRYIIIIPDKEKTSDVFHHNACIVKQCITLNNLVKTKKIKKDVYNTVPKDLKNSNDLKELKVIFANTLLQLQIKQDIKDKQINIANVSKLPQEQIISSVFVGFEKNDEENKRKNKNRFPELFSLITINSNGNIVNQSYNQNIEQLSEIYSNISQWLENERNYGEHQFLIINDNVFVLDNTGYKAIPDISKLYDRVEINRDFIKPVSHFLELFSNTIKKKDAEHLTAIKTIKELFKDENAYISISDFINTVKKCADEKMTIYKEKKKNKTSTEQIEKPKEKTMLDSFIRHLDNDNIYYYDKYRKNGRCLETVFSCYNKSCYKITDNVFSYFIQSRNPKDDPDQTVNNAPAVYSLKNINNSPITDEQKDIFLWLLCVTFVKFNCYSAKPFLFKYLDEIALNEKEKII